MVSVRFKSLGLAAAGALAVAVAGPAQAQDTYRIGVSAGMSGYLATADRPWADGVALAADYLNAHGGIGGHKIEVIVEDNRSEPQDAVTAYKKMISADKVQIFISGCVSAGNFAAAADVVRAEIPMILCSILPQRPDQVKWAFSLLPPPVYEIQTRYAYLKDHTTVRKIGVLHDPTPYSLIQKNIAEKIAGDYGLSIVGVEQYRQQDADLSVQIAKLNAAGAGALLKIGAGGSTLTAAKNIQQLALNLYLLPSTEDLAIYRPAAEILGTHLVFTASPYQVYGNLPPNSRTRKALDEFLPVWRAKYGERDATFAGRAWDAVMITKLAVERAKAPTGPALRDALEAVRDFPGTSGEISFSPSQHVGFSQNPFYAAQIVGGNVRFAQ